MKHRQFITFFIGDDLFGVDILLVREINRNFEVTPVDRAPSFVHGLLNLRGQIVTVINLALRLGLESKSPSSKTCSIIFKTNKDLSALQIEDFSQETSPDLVGLLVDKVGDVLIFDEEDIDHMPILSERIGSKFVNGVIKLNDRLLVTLNVSALFEFN
ncbi:MAG: hypothetical protein A2007_04850 [Verrucomicrobia bacterium GWC2_42_7]|nr:MAG: hypothetical protein A2007_04850 [Verrucomicrobia bacterium GWC2_42_7]